MDEETYAPSSKQNGITFGDYVIGIESQDAKQMTVGRIYPEIELAEKMGLRSTEVIKNVYLATGLRLGRFYSPDHPMGKDLNLPITAMWPITEKMFDAVSENDWLVPNEIQATVYREMAIDRGEDPEPEVEVKVKTGLVEVTEEWWAELAVLTLVYLKDHSLPDAMWHAFMDLMAETIDKQEKEEE